MYKSALYQAHSQDLSPQLLLASSMLPAEGKICYKSRVLSIPKASNPQEAMKKLHCRERLFPLGEKITAALSKEPGYWANHRRSPQTRARSRDYRNQESKDWCLTGPAASTAGPEQPQREPAGKDCLGISSVFPKFPTWRENEGLREAGKSE